MTPRALESVERRCGNCANFDGEKTPGGRWKQKIAGECRVAAPVLKLAMCFRVDFRKSYVWPKDDAKECPSWQIAP